MIFISYSKNDIEWRDRIITHLKGIDANFVDEFIWADTKIAEGDKWNDEIDRAREKAHAAILLVSDSYLASAYIRNYEFLYFLEKGISVYWFLITECVWKRTGLNELQCANVKNGNRLVPLDSQELSRSAVNRIISETCEKIYDQFQRPALAKAEHKAWKAMPVPDNFRYSYNRDNELELMELCYRHYKANEQLLLFSIEGEPNDALATLSQSLTYKSLYDIDRETDYRKVLNFRVNISNKYYGRLLSTEAIKAIFLNDFYLQIRKKLDLDHRLQNISYKNIAANCGKHIEWLTILINIPATSFSRELTDVIFTWLLADFNPDNYNRDNFRMVFIFSFEDSSDSSLNAKMHEYINKADAWFVPYYKLNSAAFESLSMNIKNPLVYHLGKHGKTTLNKFEQWCAEVGLRHRDERAYKALRRKVKEFEHNLDMNHAWSLIDQFEKIQVIKS